MGIRVRALVTFEATITRLRTCRNLFKTKSKKRSLRYWCGRSLRNWYGVGCARWYESQVSLRVASTLISTSFLSKMYCQSTLAGGAERRGGCDGVNDEALQWILENGGAIKRREPCACSRWGSGCNNRHPRSLDPICVQNSKMLGYF
jgi:hypothetical protein